MKAVESPRLPSPASVFATDPPGRLHAVLHRAVEELAPFAFHQLHDALGDPHEVEEAVVGLGEDVDDGVADPDDLVGFHVVFSSKAQRSRIRQSGQRGLRATQM